MVVNQGIETLLTELVDSMSVLPLTSSLDENDELHPALAARQYMGYSHEEFTVEGCPNVCVCVRYRAGAVIHKSVKLFLQADKGGFLLCIWKGDPVFVKKGWRPIIGGNHNIPLEEMVPKTLIVLDTR